MSGSEGMTRQTYYTPLTADKEREIRNQADYYDRGFHNRDIVQMLLATLDATRSELDQARSKLAAVVGAVNLSVMKAHDFIYRVRHGITRDAVITEIRKWQESLIEAAEGESGV